MQHLRVTMILLLPANQEAQAPGSGCRIQGVGPLNPKPQTPNSKTAKSRARKYNIDAVGPCPQKNPSAVSAVSPHYSEVIVNKNMKMGNYQT